MEVTRSFAPGFNVAARPVKSLKAAILFLCWPPILANSPAAYSMPSFTAISDTLLFALGFHKEIDPLAILTAAILFLDAFPILVNVPPI